MKSYTRQGAPRGTLKPPVGVRTSWDGALERGSLKESLPRLPGCQHILERRNIQKCLYNQKHLIFLQFLLSLSKGHLVHGNSSNRLNPGLTVNEPTTQSAKK